jgi:hypothetical protein
MARVLGLGTLNKVDDDDSGSTYTTLSLMVDITPPPRKRVRVDNTALEDTLSTDAAGIEDKSDYEFSHYYDPGATNDTIVATLFAAKTAVLWQITYADSGTETFEGIVMEIIPQPIKHNENLMRKVVVHRTGAITFA